MEVTDLWLRYKKNNDYEAKTKLIEHYAGLVKIIASRLSITLSSQAEFDDLVGYGIFGLIDAIDKFDITKEIKFETYASLRIRGAILDSLRSNDWVPRTVRTKSKELQKAIAELENILGRGPSNEEIAQHMKITKSEVLDRFSDTLTFNISSLEEMITTVGDSLAAKGKTPEEEYERTELKKIIADVLDTLKERDKLLITLYYFEELTFKEIANVMEITESRVSQIHSKTLLRLRNALSNVGIVSF